MRTVVEQQLQAEGDLCGAIFELMVGHRYSVFDVRDAVDMLTGQLHIDAPRLRASAQSKPEPSRLADFAFRGASHDTVFCA